MPVVIKELVITATLDTPPEPGAAAAPATDPAELAQLRQHLVRDCVAQVLAVLHEQAER